MEWDPISNDIGVYDTKGKNLGSMDPVTKVFLGNKRRLLNFKFGSFSNAISQLRTETDPLGKYPSYTYDINGNVTGTNLNQGVLSPETVTNQPSGYSIYDINNLRFVLYNQ